MRITLHRDGVGVTDSGQWVERRPEGWEPIERPAWADVTPAKPAPEVHAMTDPYRRQASGVLCGTSGHSLHAPCQ